MKQRKTTRKFPLFLTTLVAVGATAAALHYRYKLEDAEEGTLDVHPELLREVREEGAILMYWVDDAGKHCFKTTYDSTNKND